MTAPTQATRPTLEQLLTFEARHGAHTGEKGDAIRREFAITPARYYQLLHRAIDTQEAIVLDPILVGHLRRRRDAAVEKAASRIR